MESNVLLAEFAPPQSQQTKSGSELSDATLGRHKELNGNNQNNAPTPETESHQLERLINQLKLINYLHSPQVHGYRNMDSSSPDKTPAARQIPQQHELSSSSNSNNNNNQTTKNNPEPPSALPHTSPPTKMKACRAPLSRKFAHPCSCDSKNHHKNSAHHNTHTNNNVSANLQHQPPPYPLYLYDPLSRKCLPTSRHRDMLLRDCLSHPQPPPAGESAPGQQQTTMGAHSLKQTPSVIANQACIYDDLRCDPRRLKCVCKPSMHLYYESNWSSFGCVPINLTAPPDGISCRKDQIYNVISKECQKIFDINDLPPSYMSSLSANQFPFVTLALIWVLLLIVILTAKLRKIRTTTTHHHRHSSSMAMRNNRAGLSHQRQYSYYGPPTLVHSIMAAFHGHQHLNQDVRRGSLDGHSDPTSRNYNDTDFFLSGGAHHHRHSRELFGGEGGFTDSQQSLNNPPPKFEDIYPSCPIEPLPPPPPSPGAPRTLMARPLSNDNLPSYQEAMKLQNTKPPDGKE